MDRLTKEQRRKNMQHVRNKDSEIELKLRLALWKNGFRYRKNVREIFGCPDIVFKKISVTQKDFFYLQKFSKPVE